MERKSYADKLNVLACFAVIAMHVNSRFWHFSADARWNVSLLIESLAYPAVGLFLMLSGATLIDYRKRYSTGVYFKKRVMRVVLPYVLWSLLAIVFHVLKGQLTWQQLTLSNLAYWLLHGSYYSVYWFFGPLFSCYLAIPVIGCIEENKRIKACMYMAMLSFATICVMPMLGRHIGIAWNSELNTAISAGYLIYPLLGYVLSRVEIKKPQRLVLYALGLLGMLLRMIMTWKLSLRAGIVDYEFGSYLNYPCVLQTVAVFVWFKQRDGKGTRFARLCEKLTVYSFPIFLMHKFVMDVLDRFALEPKVIENSVLHPLIMPTVIYWLCVAVCMIAVRIPVMCFLFGWTRKPKTISSDT